MSDVERRVCVQCEKNLNVKRFEGTTNVCRTCVKQSKSLINKENVRVSKEVHNSLVANARRMISEMEVQVVTEAPPLSEHVRSLIEAYGGVQGIAVCHVAEYLMAKPGSPTRQRLLADVGKHISKNSELGGGKLAMDAMTDEELDEYIEQRARKVLTVVES